MTESSTEARWGDDPIRRLALARRVARQLSDLADDVLVEVATESARMDPPDSLVSDFVLTSYDLELRVSLLVRRTVDGASPSPEDYLESAQALLDLYPDTDAAVLVADDAPLSAVIVEPFDREIALRLDPKLGSRTRRSRSGPLRQLVQTYLRDMSPVWSAFAELPLVQSDDITQLAIIAARDALSAHKAEALRVPEKRVAQAALSLLDANFVAELCVAVVRNESEPVSRIREWVDEK